MSPPAGAAPPLASPTGAGASAALAVPRARSAGRPDLGTRREHHSVSAQSPFHPARSLGGQPNLTFYFFSAATA